MRFLIDADLPRSAGEVIRRYGHEVVDVRDIGLGEAKDPIIAHHARTERLCLITGDYDFANIRNYPPEQYAGIVVLYLPRNATATYINHLRFSPFRVTMEVFRVRNSSNTLRHYPWLRRFTLTLRILLAIGFLPSGLTKVLGNRFTILGIDTPVGFFFEGLYRSGFYWRFIGMAQLLAALLLLIPRTAALGALIYFPIILNIFVITVSMRFQGTPFITGLMLLGCLYLLCWDYERLQPLWAQRREGE